MGILSGKDTGSRIEITELNGAVFNIYGDAYNQAWVKEGERKTISITRSGDLTDTHVVTLNESGRASQLPAKAGEDFLADFAWKTLVLVLEIQANLSR